MSPETKTYKRAISRILNRPQAHHYASSGTSANAGPHYQKLYARVTHIWGNRKGQPNRSAMKGPHLERTASLITVPPASGKYEKLRSRQQRKNSLTPRPLVVVVRRSGNVLSPFTCLEVRPALRGEKRKMLMLFCFKLNISSPKGSGPHSEVVLYRGNPWLGRGKPLFHSPVPKISLIYELLNEQRIRY